MLTDIDYDEMTDDYYGTCLAPGCGWIGPGRSGCGTQTSTPTGTKTSTTTR